MLHKFFASLARLHKATETSFAKFGHIYFFAPMAIDHFHTVYGQVNAAILAAYTVAAVVAANTDA